MNILKQNTIIYILAIMLMAFVFYACDDGNDNSQTKTFIVTFNAGNGSVPTTQTITEGDKAVRPIDPIKIGYECKFIGWFKEADLTNAWDFDTNTVNGNITLYAKWRSYDIGEIGPGEGVIYYRTSDGFIITDNNSTAFYLEASPNDMLTKLTWASSIFWPESFGGTGSWQKIGTEETAIGTGRKNTALILATDNDAPAAKTCINYNGGNLNDWFLPSKDELNLLYNSKNYFGNLEEGVYYSSSENETMLSMVWSQNFGTGDQYYTRKGGHNSQNISELYLYSVRAIRAF